VDDSRFLKDNAGNLAAVLLHLSEEEPDRFAEIQEHLREVIPAFKRFDLTAKAGSTRLDWRDKHAGELFGPHQISDGSLRMMALVTLLSLPDDMIPSVIVIDEPELGLFLKPSPAAVAWFGSAGGAMLVLQAAWFFHRFVAHGG
jgi:predicted ATPase